MASTSHTRPAWSVKRGPFAALASAVLPGWGQIYAGRRQLGRRLLIIDAALFVLLLLTLAVFRLEVVKLWVSPAAIAVLMGLNLALLFYRWIATSDAFDAVDDTVTPQWVINVSLVGIGFLLVVPHLAFGYLAVTQYSLIQTVFGDTTSASADPASTGPAGDPDPNPVIVAAGDDQSTDTASESTTTSLAAPTFIWDGLERLNIVLLGADAGEGRTGLRTDTTIVVSIDPETGDAAMFSVPRDLSAIPLPPEMGIWGCDCFPDLIDRKSVV